MEKILFYLSYFTYIILTLRDRHLYKVGLAKGYDCLGTYDVYTMWGITTKYLFDKESKPKRTYKTFQEYKKMYEHKKKSKEI